MAKRNLYWSPAHEAMLKAASDRMIAAGIPCQRADGEVNMSAVILYALAQLAKGKGDDRV